MAIDIKQLMSGGGLNMAAPSATPSQEATQPRRGLLGGFFGPDGRDARQRLAIGLEGMTMRPNQALIGGLQEEIARRGQAKETATQKNATLEWLRSRGRDDLAEAVAGGLPAVDALRMAVQPPDPMAALDLQIKQMQLESMRNPQADPMAALELQIKQMQLESMRNPQADPMAALQLEKAQLELEKMRTPEAGYRQVKGFELGLTGADADRLFNVSPSGQVTAIGGAGTTVNVDTGAGGKFEEAFAKGDAATIDTVYSAGLQAARNIGRIDQLDALLQAAPTGAVGALKLAAGEFGINTEGLSDIQAAQAMINSLVPEQRQPGSGPMSDADLALFKQSLPRIINQPGGNQVIINSMRAIAKYDADGARIVQQLRAGSIDRATAFQLLQDRENPLAAFRAPAGPVAGAPAGAPSVRTFNPATGKLE